MAATSQPDNESPIHCSSEWHMRNNPRAFLIYSIALRLTDGGQNEFYLSQAKLAPHLEWDRKTVRKAIRALCDAGLFKLLRRGKGGNGTPDLANVYRVIPHSKLVGVKHCEEELANAAAA